MQLKPKGLRKYRCQVYSKVVWKSFYFDDENVIILLIFNDS